MLLYWVMSFFNYQVDAGDWFYRQLDKHQRTGTESINDEWSPEYSGIQAADRSESAFDGLTSRQENVKEDKSAICYDTLQPDTTTYLSLYSSLAERDTYDNAITEHGAMQSDPSENQIIGDPPIGCTLVDNALYSSSWSLTTVYVLNIFLPLWLIETRK